MDVEADGPIPGDYSMIAIGAIKVSDLSVGFLRYLKPISSLWQPEALAVSGFSREETETFESPTLVMQDFHDWLLANSEGHPIFVADNNGFDWQFVNWYFWSKLNQNPFGFSSRNLNDIYHGLVGDARASFKHLRQTKHDHNPLNDAKGNAEALLYMRDNMNFKVKL